MGTTSHTQAYGESSYWDNRYAGDSKPFDWYQKYSSLSPLVRLYVSPPDRPRVLVVGCGNSLFSEQMVDDGYEDVVNVDVSSVVIDEMKKKYANRPQLRYMVMDVRDMSAFESASFGVVIDKGTLDSLLCGSNSQTNAEKMLQEVARVLRDKGVYILITYGSPTYRLHLLRQINLWTIKLHVIDKFSHDKKTQHQWELTKPVPLDGDASTVEASLGKNPDVHYIYVCRKVESLEHE
ncbi:hypothetical protein MLD38_023627 [Melastoma candidum]|uniref:Uncharacterized protein n=1 Tax=Melastoma candidum TaxID=119954 RepID=A0ACB9NT62_9MYRT|nr:hypothetical protein MLD38_023627 [Melastoma candidum]